MQKLFTVCSFIMLMMFAAFGNAAAQNKNLPTDANIVGHVVNATTHEHIPGIILTIKGTEIRTATDKSGHYAFRNLRPGKLTIIARGVGYKTAEQSIVVERGKTVELNFVVDEDAVELDEVVVTANRQATLRRVAPTLVTVLDSRLFDKTNSNNLSQGLIFQPGVRVENNCQNCGFNQVRINGLDGRYSQILIDSRPTMSALAGVYGIEQIPTNMVDRVEVIRGGGSALFGSSAIAGVINIITKEPTTNSITLNENFTMLGMKKPDNNLSFNASIVDPNNKVGGMIYGQSRHRSAWDQNGDGFSEIGMLESRSLGGHFFVRPTTYSRLTGEIHTIQEDRRGGDHLDWPDHVALISEHIRHYIYSGNARYDLFSQDFKHHFQAYIAGQVIRRESFYGGIGEYEDPESGTLGHPVSHGEYGDNYGVSKGRTYNAGLQYNYNFDKFLFLPAELLIGTEYTYDRLKDVMPIRSWALGADNKTPLFPALDQKINVFSQLAQLEWKNDLISILFGARLDKNSLLEKPVFSPRTTFRLNPSKSVNLRMSYAKGFRAPQVFDEDLHVAVVGGEAKKVRNEKELKPEISHSFSLSADTYFRLGDARCNLLGEAFYSIIKDVFVEENDQDASSADGIKHMVRKNGSGAKVAGFNLEGKIAYSIFSLQAGMTYNHARYDEAESYGERTQLVDKGKLYLPSDMPEVLNGKAPKFAVDQESGEFKNVEVKDRHYQRTPTMYGYFTMGITPVKNFSIDLTGTITGSMYVPHVIEWGTEYSTIGKDLVANHKWESVSAEDAYNALYGANAFKNKFGENNDDVDGGAAPHWDMLQKTKAFFDMGLKLSYKFNLFKAGTMQLYAGMTNILNSFQNDFDFGGGRDSGYIYGPEQPRSVYCGVKFSL